jgi:hypothetical protein
MNLKKTIVALVPLLWVFFYIIDFISRMTSGAVVFRRWQPFILIARGVQSIKRLSVFALIILNVFLVWNWMGHSLNRSKS